jgi:hypothetical protein
MVKRSKVLDYSVVVMLCTLLGMMVAVGCWSIIEKRIRPAVADRYCDTRDDCL